MAYKRSRQAFEADLQKQESPYVFYGTPLPPLDEQVRDDGSFVPVWKQEVTDDRGRKRLHGAFTGGYSAGYYNSVGSKEGWTPSTFVSSRQNRAKDAKDAKASNQQRPEDFMDEEDLREAEDARQLQTADAFSGFGTASDEQHKGTIMDIFHPTGETAGVRLLKRMGWREGQGIGPKVKRPANLGDNTQHTDELHTFAPDDVPMISFSQKHDRKGLGFGRENVSQNGTPKPSTSKGPGTASKEGDEEDNDSAGPMLGPRKAKASKQKGAFGFGVLNDTGSDDDDDPYSMGPRISYSKTLGGDKRPKRKVPQPSPNANPALKTKPVLVSKKLASIQGALRKCHDGRLPLDGFVLADDLDGMATLSLKNDKYKPPPVPADWKSSFTPTQESQPPSSFISTADAAKTSTLTSTSRATLLGEATLPGKSVFDFLTPSARNRLASASGKSNLPPGLGEKPSSSSDPSTTNNPALQDLIPKLDQDVALQALTRGQSGWMPYSDDLPKRERYKTFLEIRAGLRPTEAGDELPPRAPGVSRNDWIVELHEFARAAEVFRPVTGLMASRFTTGSSSTLLQPSDAGGAAELLSRPKPKPLDPAEEAARLGMFGQMTRSYVNFYPTRLLCKRFGVAMPDHGDRPAREAPTPASTAAAAAAAAGASAVPDSKFQSAGYQSSERGEPATPAIATQSTSRANQMMKSEPMDDVKNMSNPSTVIDTDRNEALEQERPGQALFKAIFGSDDEDSDDD